MFTITTKVRPQFPRLLHRSPQLREAAQISSFTRRETRRCFSSTSVNSGADKASRRPIIGVQAALADPATEPKRTIFDEFSLKGRVSVVTGGKQGIGLEIAMALAEAGSSVYCLDLQSSPGEDFEKTARYVSKLAETDRETGSLKYLSADVTKQAEIWKTVEEVASTEGRMDVAVANAGILRNADCLDYKDVDFQALMNVNTNGVLYTAQAAGRQMARFKMPGSIILIASMSGSVTNKRSPGKAHNWVAYNTSKSAVIQMARSMACELGPQGIRVNSLSPGYITTALTLAYLDTVPGLREEWSTHNPLGRLGRTDELRGAALWLASDASTFCTGSDILVSGGHHSW